MNFKPNEFFIGLVEFITILLPGAELTCNVLMTEANRPLQSTPLYEYAFLEKTNLIFWISYVFLSFGLGYFLSSIASGLDQLYNRIRKQVYPYEEDLRKCFSSSNLETHSEYLKLYEEINNSNLILEEKSDKTENEKSFEGYKIKYKNNFFRRLLHFFFELERTIKINCIFGKAKKLLVEQYQSVRNATNTYKWAGTILEAYFPTISEQATRIMAASKFFKSLVIVFFVFLTLQILGQLPSQAWQINFLILVFPFENIVQRQKSVQKTYQSIVTLTYFKKH